MSARGRWALALLLAWPAPASGADPLAARTFAAPLAQVWVATERALREQAWGIDDADRTVGVIVTKSHRLSGNDDGGVQAKTIRLRLRLTLIAADHGQTVVRVQREVFARERVLWMEKDDPVGRQDPLAADDRSVERRLLTAIGKAL